MMWGEQVCHSNRRKTLTHDREHRYTDNLEQSSRNSSSYPDIYGAERHEHEEILTILVLLKITEMRECIYENITSFADTNTHTLAVFSCDMKTLGGN